jgi:uncharacterized protein (DUF849 family)
MAFRQLPIATQAVLIGGNLWVGLADSLWIGAGKIAAGTAGQEKVAPGIVERLCFAVATPDEARKLLALKGGERVAF